MIDEELRRPGLRRWLGSKTEVHVSKMDACRAWKDHWSPLKVGLQGGLLEDKSANHAFVFIRRKGWAFDIA